MRRTSIPLVLAFFLAGAAPVAWSLDFALPEPLWSSIEGEGRQAWREAWTQIRDQVRADAQPLTLREGASFGVRVHVSGQPGSYSAVYQREGGGAADAVKALTFAQPDSDAILMSARVIAALLRSGGTPHPLPAPTLVDAFSPAELQGVDLPIPAAQLSPYGLAVRPSGTVVVAAGSSVLEFDRRWAVVGQPARSLADDGLFNFAFGLALTPAGTVFLKSVDGSGLWSVAEGSNQTKKIRVEVPAGASFGVLADGSLFWASLNPRSLRRAVSGNVVDVPLAAEAMVMAAAAGPEETLWLADVARGLVLVVDIHGRLLDVVVPELTAGSAIVKLKVESDGSFFAVTTQDLRYFDRRGVLLWSWDGRSEGLSLTFSLYTDVGRGPDGLLFLNDSLGKRILRLALNEAALPADLRRVAAAARAVRSAPDDPERLWVWADTYRAMGATEPERTVLERYRDLRPADSIALDRLLGLRADLLSAQALSGEAMVLATLSRLGPETARPSYARTMRTLEALRSQSPHDLAVNQRITSLRRAMTEADNPTTSRPLPHVKSVDLAALFPSLLQVYRTSGAGSLVLANTLSESLRDLRVDLFLPKYMDFPSTGPSLARVAAGAEARLVLPALLNDRVFEVEEDLPVQVQLTVRFTDSSGPRSFELFRPLTLYRRTALTWEDTGRLASFVTPNEDTVSQAAFQLFRDGNLARQAVLISDAFQRARLVCDSLGALPLRYVPDPQSSFVDVAGDRTQVDTVRFARTTLAYQAGDCDDTTALLASLLEALGVRTALLTSPGHVFLAFDSGVRPELAWTLQVPGFETLVHDGVLWVPLESTVLSQGFTEAWASASLLVARHRGTAQLEVLPLAGQRGLYPALPLPPSTLPAPRWDASQARELAAKSGSELDQRVYLPLAQRLEAERSKVSGLAWAKLSNRLALVQARFGHRDRADLTLRAVIEKEPSYQPARQNLVLLAQGGQGTSSSQGTGERASAPLAPSWVVD